MADFNEYSQKGECLMLQALKKLADGDIEAFEKDRKEANRYFDLFYIAVNSEEGIITGLYGESRNFGVIYNVIEQNMDKLLETKKGKKIVKDVYNLIKGNKVLNEQFKIYDLFEKAKNVDNVKDFVNEALSVVKKHDRKVIMENNEKLISLIKKNNLEEFVEIPEDVENLYEAIEYVLLNKKTIDNVSDFVKAQNTIVEYVEKSNNENINENKTDNKMLFNNFKETLISKQKDIDESINDDEKKLIESFTNIKNDKRKIFEEYKSKSLSMLKEAIENSVDDEKKDWEEVYESVKAKKYSDNNISDNIINCAEMMEICSTLKL